MHLEDPEVDVDLLRISNELLGVGDGFFLIHSVLKNRLVSWVLARKCHEKHACLTLLCPLGNK